MENISDIKNNLSSFCASIIKCNLKGFTLILLFSTIISSIGLANTYLMSQILDVLSQGATKHMVVNFIIIFIIVQSVKALVTYIFQYIVMKYNMKISNSLVKMIVNRLHGVKILSVKKYDSVYLAERLDSDTMLVTNFVISSLPSICMNIIILLLVFNLVVLIELKYGIILACICGLYILLYLLFKNGLYIKMLNYRNAKSRYLQSINEQIAFIDYVQIHVIYRAFLKRLAAELGITQQMLSKYEKDVTVIKVDILKRLAEYFNVTTDYLLGMSDVKRDLTGQIKLNETLDEYYDMIEVYKTLDQYDQELVWSLLQIVRKNEEKKKKDRENDKCSNL